LFLCHKVFKKKVKSKISAALALNKDSVVAELRSVTDFGISGGGGQKIVYIVSENILSKQTAAALNV